MQWKRWSLISLCVLSLISMVGAQQSSPTFHQTKEEFIKMLSPTPPDASGYEVRGTEQRGPDAIVDDYATLTQNPLARSLILFDFDSNAIKPESYPILKNLADALQNELRDVVLVIAGHADSTGAEAYNLELSQRRATAVQEFLAAAYNVAPDRLVVRWYGELQPLYPNGTETNRAYNRRVEFIRVQ